MCGKRIINIKGDEKSEESISNCFTVITCIDYGDRNNNLLEKKYYQGLKKNLM